MGMLAWVMMGLAIWHFTIFLPDRFWGGIVGAFLGALIGAVVFGLIVNGFTVPGQDDTDLLTAARGDPGRRARHRGRLLRGPPPRERGAGVARPDLPGVRFPGDSSCRSSQRAGAPSPMVGRHALASGPPERPLMRNRSARAASCTTPLRAASPTADPRRLRRSLLCALALCALAAAPATAGADPPTATLDVVPDGNGTVTISPAPAGAAACVGSSLKLPHCAYAVATGETVTLTAAPNLEPPEVQPPTAFVGWSDARCPGTGPCTLPVDSDAQTVTALFSPQRVTVKSVGTGTVTTPAAPPSPRSSAAGVFSTAAGSRSCPRCPCRRTRSVPPSS